MIDLVCRILIRILQNNYINLRKGQNNEMALHLYYCACRPFASWALYPTRIIALTETNRKGKSMDNWRPLLLRGEVHPRIIDCPAS
jgi:hypothetical protein